MLVLPPSLLTNVILFCLIYSLLRSTMMPSYCWVSVYLYVITFYIRLMFLLLTDCSLCLCCFCRTLCGHFSQTTTVMKMKVVRSITFLWVIVSCVEKRLLSFFIVWYELGKEAATRTNASSAFTITACSLELLCDCCRLTLPPSVRSFHHIFLYTCVHQ